VPLSRHPFAAAASRSARARCADPALTQVGPEDAKRPKHAQVFVPQNADWNPFRHSTPRVAICRSTCGVVMDRNSFSVLVGRCFTMRDRVVVSV